MSFRFSFAIVFLSCFAFVHCSRIVIVGSISQEIQRLESEQESPSRTVSEHGNKKATAESLRPEVNTSGKNLFEGRK